MKKVALLILVFLNTGFVITAQTNPFSQFTELDYYQWVLQNQENRKNSYFDVKAGEYQKLDSVIRPGYYKEHYYYNDQGRNTQYIYFFDSDNSYNDKVEFVYDNNGNLTLIDIYKWDISLNQWIISSKQEATYSGNILSSIISFNWENEQWSRTYKTELAYNSDSNPTVIISFSWDNGTEQWNNYYKVEYTYDENRKRISELPWTWEVNQWSNSSKTTYLYDTNGNMILYTNYSWDISTSDWLATYKGEFTYDEFNRPIVTYHLGSQDGIQWIYYRKIDYTYSYSCSPDNLILPFFREYYYDGFIDITTASFTMHKWDSDLNAWYVTYTKDKYFSKITILSVSTEPIVFESSEGSSAEVDIVSSTNWTVTSNQDWLTVSQTKGLLETTITGSGDATIILTASVNQTSAKRTATVTISGTGVVDKIITVSQEGLITGYENAQENGNNIYPNPTTNVLYINSVNDNIKISIFDLNGRVVLSMQTTDNKLDISNLQNGIYTLRIENGVGLRIQKFIKQ